MHISKRGSASSDKNLIPNQTIGNGLQTNISLSGAPVGYVSAFVNGLLYVTGNGVNTRDCHFVGQNDPVWASVISLGLDFSIALKSDWTAWTWGINTNGNLGNNSTNNRSSPISVAGAHSFYAIDGSRDNAFGLKADGSAWGWGDNSAGAVGDDSTTSRSSPVSVVGGHSFAKISGRFQYALALKNDGTAWSWGQGGSGRLGNNDTALRSSPVSVVGGHVFSKISTGPMATFSATLKSDGTIWTWGSNTAGELGLNTGGNRSSPVSVVGNHSFIAASCGDFNHFMSAIKADGSAWGWGSNLGGSLGDNSTTNRSSPVSVIGNHSFIAIGAGGEDSAGTQHVIALKADGSAWSWGYADNGRLGDNQSTSNRSSPVSVVGLHSFVSIAVGASHAIGFKADGTLWAWGKNTGGTLGDGTANNRSSPVSILGSSLIRSFGQISNGDNLVWNGTNVGFDLSATDKINLDYV